jgi:hypothetical protein
MLFQAPAVIMFKLQYTNAWDLNSYSQWFGEDVVTGKKESESERFSKHQRWSSVGITKSRDIRAKG